MAIQTLFYIILNSFLNIECRVSNLWFSSDKFCVYPYEEILSIQVKIIQTIRFRLFDKNHDFHITPPVRLLVG